MTTNISDGVTFIPGNWAYYKIVNKFCQWNDGFVRYDEGFFVSSRWSGTHHLHLKSSSFQSFYEKRKKSILKISFIFTDWYTWAAIFNRFHCFDFIYYFPVARSYCAHLCSPTNIFNEVYFSNYHPLTLNYITEAEMPLRNDDATTTTFLILTSNSSLSSTTSKTSATNWR